MSPYRRDFDETKYISFLTKKKKKKMGRKPAITSKESLIVNLYIMKNN